MVHLFYLERGHPCVIPYRADPVSLPALRTASYCTKNGGTPIRQRNIDRPDVFLQPVSFKSKGHRDIPEYPGFASNVLHGRPVQRLADHQSSQIIACGCLKCSPSAKGNDGSLNTYLRCQKPGFDSARKFIYQPRRRAMAILPRDTRDRLKDRM